MVKNYLDTGGDSCTRGASGPSLAIRFVASAIGIAALGAAVIGLLVPARANAASADVALLSGTLSDSAGNPINQKTLLRARAYLSHNPAASPVWEESQSVNVVDGQFTLPLGLEVPFPSELLTQHEVFVGIAVGADAEMVPRIQLAAVPAAWRAVDADTVAGMVPSDFAQSGQVCGKGTVVESIDASGSLGCIGLATVAISGDFNDLKNVPAGQGPPTTVGPGLPANPTTGQLHFNTTGNALHVYTGAKWEVATWQVGSLVAPVDVSANNAMYAFRASQSAGGAALRGRALGASSVGLDGVATGADSVAVAAFAGSGAQAAVRGEVADSNQYAAYFVGGRNYFSGRVGMGTADPQYPLHLESNTTGIVGRFASSSGSGATTAVSAQVNSPDGRGVFGVAASGTGENTGIWGRTSSPQGRGVYGQAFASAGGTGVLGTASGTGSGVRGVHSGTSGAGMGVYGESSSPTGWAAYFQGRARITGDLELNGSLAGASGLSATSPTGTGILGQTLATGGIGVQGLHAASSGNGTGVYGSTNSPNGHAAQFVGRVNVVGGTDHTAITVSQFSQQAAISATSWHTTNTSSSSAAIRGIAAGGPTLTANTSGVYGQTEHGGGAGVRGVSTAANSVWAAGVEGSATGAGAGVRGTATSGVGGDFRCSGSGCTALYAQANSASGLAGDFFGRVLVSGALEATTFWSAIAEFNFLDAAWATLAYSVANRAAFGWNPNNSSEFTAVADVRGTESVDPLRVRVGADTALRVHSANRVSVGDVSGPTDKLQVDAAAGEDALRVRVSGATKMRVHANGGVSVGSNFASTVPIDGIRVAGEGRFGGTIQADDGITLGSGKKVTCAGCVEGTALASSAKVTPSKTYVVTVTEVFQSDSFGSFDASCSGGDTMLSATCLGTGSTSDAIGINMFGEQKAPRAVQYLSGGNSARCHGVNTFSSSYTFQLQLLCLSSY